MCQPDGAGADQALRTWSLAVREHLAELVVEPLLDRALDLVDRLPGEAEPGDHLVDPVGVVRELGVLAHLLRDVLSPFRLEVVDHLLEAVVDFLLQRGDAGQEPLL